MKVRYQFLWPRWSAASSAVILSLTALASCGTASIQQPAESQVNLKLPVNELSSYQMSEAEMGDVRHELRRLLRVEVPKAARQTRQDIDRLSYVLIPLRQAPKDYEANIDQLRLDFDSANQEYTISYQITAESQPDDSYAINGTGRCGLRPDANSDLAWAADVSKADGVVIPSKRAFVPTVTSACRNLLATTTTTVCRTLNKYLRLRSATSRPA